MSEAITVLIILGLIKFGDFMSIEILYSLAQTMLRSDAGVFLKEDNFPAHQIIVISYREVLSNWTKILEQKILAMPLKEEPYAYLLMETMS